MNPAHRLFPFQIGYGITSECLEREIRKYKTPVHVIREYHLGEIVGHQPELLFALPKYFPGSSDPVSLTPNTVGSNQHK